MIANLLAGLALGVATLSGLALMAIGLSSDSGRDGGRLLGSMMAALPFAVALLVAGAVAVARGGFDMLGLPRPATCALVLLALLCAAVLTLFSAAMRLERASQVPWAMLPLRGWLHLPWPPLLLGLLAWALWPTLFPAGLAALGRPLALVLGGVSLVACALMLVQWAQVSQQAAVDRVQAAQERDQQRDEWIRAQVIAADVSRDLVSLMNQTSRWETPDIRALALAKARSHPQLTQALTEMLRGPWRDHAFTFLASNDPPDPVALVDAVREGIAATADDVRDSMRRTHTMYPDQFVPEVERLMETAERFAPLGLDAVPALREVRRALDTPRDQPSGTPDLRARHLLDRWLARHGTKETRPGRP